MSFRPALGLAASARSVGLLGLSVLLVAAVTVVPAGAQPPSGDRGGGPPGGGPPGAGGGAQWSLGLGVVLGPEPYVGADSVDVQPVPVIGLEVGRFYFRGIVAGLELVDGDGWSLDWVIGKARFMGYEEDDSDFLDGMEDRDLSIDGGLAASVELGGGLELGLEALTDLLGEHEGQELSLSLSRGIQRGRQWRLTPSVSAVWQSEDLVDYYYGVRADETRPGRPAYQPSDSINAEIGLEALYFSRGRWLWRGRVSLDWLGSEIEDSPIVDQTTAISGFTFIAWRL